MEHQNCHMAGRLLKQNQMAVIFSFNGKQLRGFEGEYAGLGFAGE